MESYFLVGEVLKPQGIRGEAKVRPYASNPDDYFRWSTMYLEKDGQYRPIGVKCSRVHDGFAYMTLKGCTGPEDVEKYLNIVPLAMVPENGQKHKSGGYYYYTNAGKGKSAR